MNFHTRKWVKPEDLNSNGTLFGGSLLRWIDEEAAIYAISQLGNQRVVTKFMSEINFVSSARQGDIIELGITATHFGRTSVTLRAEVRNKITRKSILTVEKMVFVNLNEQGEPAPHGRTQIRYADELFEAYPIAAISARSRRRRCQATISSRKKPKKRHTESRTGAQAPVLPCSVEFKLEDGLLARGLRRRILVLRQAERLARIRRRRALRRAFFRRGRFAADQRAEERQRE
ncbi:MAG: cytosolic long-chain acyl-CoA thioester hydrolase family protein [uncultured Caballeronia sp.]|nr:MAG: cytosolic long-chain acyl-CoA thioester hydrolase family protein [uncultured Caballeronia sp.]